MQQKTCPVCGDVVPREILTYCGAMCYAKARRKQQDVVCFNCHATFSVRPFEARRSKKHYCQNCRGPWQNRQPKDRPLTGYTLDCFFCGTPIYRPRWYSRRYLFSFCSKQCRRAGWASLRLAHEGIFSTKEA